MQPLLTLSSEMPLELQMPSERYCKNTTEEIRAVELEDPTLISLESISLDYIVGVKEEHHNR
jgi:hypothetical protein